jgi:hypothetical protein
VSLNTTSSYYYNRIDQAFPVSGQDNDSQGFRSNFQNIYQSVLNLDTDLQNSKINSAKVNSVNDFAYTGTLKRAVIQSTGFTAENTAPVNGTIDFSLGSFHKSTISGDTTFEVENWPPTGIYGIVRLQVVPTTSTQMVINFSAGAGDLLVDGGDVIPYYSTDVAPIFYDIWTSDNGDTVTVKQVVNSTTGTTGVVVGAQKVTQPVTDNTNTNYATTEFVHNILPRGTILMWSGAQAAIPTGWRICDGTNSTPDLRDKFIVGAGTSYTVGQTGGSPDSIVVQHSHDITDIGHHHLVAANADAGGGTGNPLTASNYLDKANGGMYTLQGGATVATLGKTSTSTTGISVDSYGSIGTGANLPPYYALCFIMKTTGD